MKIEEFKIKAYDKVNLYAKCWLPMNKPLGVIILIHGLGEHINRYNQWAKRFNNSGWAVAGIDLRGHGFSEGKRGNGNYHSYLNDIDSIFEFVSKEFENLPKVLYGHSMGGNLALGYEITRKPDIERLIVTSPWLKLVNPPAITLQIMSRIFVKLFPSLSVSNRLNSYHISRDKAICEDYKKDPLVHNQISLSSFLQMQDWAAVILKNKHKISVPLLLLHGSDDKITSCKGSDIFARETSDNTQFKIWENCYHELHNEVYKEEIFEFISLWLSEIQNLKHKANVG